MTDTLSLLWIEKIIPQTMTDDGFPNDDPMPVIDTDLMKELIGKGVDVNLQNKDGETALLVAQNAAQTMLLLRAGADPNLTDYCWNTPLQYSRDVHQTALLLSAGARVNTQNCNGISALSMAKKRQIELLLLAGADVNIRSHRGKAYLDEHKSLSKEQDLAIQAEDKKGPTVLEEMMMMSPADPEKEKALIAAGAEVPTDYIFERTFDSSVRTRDNPFGMSSKLREGVDVNYQDKNGRTALMNTSNLDEVKLLLSANAKIHLVDKDGQTAITLAKGEKLKLLTDLF